MDHMEIDCNDLSANMQVLYEVELEVDMRKGGKTEGKGKQDRNG
jgi:hypothetical protein